MLITVASRATINWHKLNAASASQGPRLEVEKELTKQSD